MAETLSGNKNKLLIVIIIVVLLLAVAGFAGQKLMQKASIMVGQKVGEKVAEGIIEKATGGKADVNLNKDSVSVKTKDGSFSTNTTLPTDWPKDVSIYPGSTLKYSGTSNLEKRGSEFGAVFTTKDSGQLVYEYYKKELPQQGWTESSSQQTEGVMVITATKNDRTFSMATSVFEGLTQINLGVSQQNQ